MSEWQDGYQNGYTQGIGIVISFLEHVAEIAPPRESKWTKELADAIRRAAADIPPDDPPGDVA